MARQSMNGASPKAGRVRAAKRRNASTTRLSTVKQGVASTLNPESVMWLLCLGLMAAGVAATMWLGTGKALPEARPAAVRWKVAAVLGSGALHDEPVAVLPAFPVAAVWAWLLVAAGPERGILLVLTSFWGLEAGIGDGIRVPDEARYIVVACLALSVLAVVAARRAKRSILEMKASSRPDLAFKFVLNGRDMSLPMDAKVGELKRVMLQEARGGAKPPDGTADDRLAKCFFLSCNDKALKDCKTLVVIPQDATIRLEVRPLPLTFATSLLGVFPPSKFLYGRDVDGRKTRHARLPAIWWQVRSRGGAGGRRNESDSVTKSPGGEAGVEAVPSRISAKAPGRRPARLPPLDGSLRDKDDAEAYFEAHNIKAIMQDLTDAIFMNRPDQPLPFLRDKITELMAAGHQEERGDDGDTPEQPRAGCRDACAVRIVVECEGPGGVMRSHKLRRIVAPGDAKTLASAKEATAEMLSTVWGTATAMVTSLQPSKPLPLGAATESDGGSVVAEQGGAESHERQGASVPVGASTPEAKVVDTNEAVRCLRQMLAKNPTETFARADVDGSGDLSFEEWERAFGDQVDSAALKVLFDEMDSNKDGKVSWQEFKDGLDSVPTVGELDVIKGVLHRLQLDDLFAENLLPILRARKKGGKEFTTNDVREHLQPEDISAAWQGAKKAAEEKLGEHLEALRQDEEAVVGAQEMNLKFAASSDVFEAMYGKFREFLGGVAEQVGLPAVKLYNGMKIQFCDGPHANEEITTSNYGGTKTTAKLEFEFVTEPDLSKEYPGGRMGIEIEVFLLAAGAQRRDGGERLDMSLAEIQQRYGEDMLDSVKTSLLRKATEAFMTEPALRRVAKHLKTTPESSLASTVPLLEQLADIGTDALRELRKAITNALKKAGKDARVASTGAASFQAVARDAEVTKVLRRKSLDSNCLDVLVEVARDNLMAAGLTEEEVVGLRAYTGPSFMLINGSLRKATADGAHSNVIHAICSGITKLSQVAAIPEGRVLYRGMCGRRLPEEFWKADRNGAKGGVERALLSTTSSWEVAVQYVGDGALPIIFAIECGAVDKGACLSWLSQFPDEIEYLLPPRSYLEVVGPAKQVHIGGSKAVLQVPLRVSCNLNTPTIEKSRASRQTQLLSLFDHTLLEIKRDLEALKTDPRVVARAQKDVFCTKFKGEEVMDAQGNDRAQTLNGELAAQLGHHRVDRGGVQQVARGRASPGRRVVQRGGAVQERRGGGG